MQWDAIGAIGEILGALAVFISLIYLALQIKKNTKAVESGTHQSMLQQEIATTSLLINNPELDDIVNVAETQPADLTPDQWRKFVRYAYMSLNIWETAFLNYRAETIDRDRFEAWDEACKILLDYPGYRLFWAENHLGFSREFAAHVGRFFELRPGEQPRTAHEAE